MRFTILHKENMNILRLSPHYYFESKKWPSEYDPLGGMQTQIAYLTEKLAECKIPQIVITSGYPGANPIQQEYLQVIPISHFFIKIKSKVDGLVGFNLFWIWGVMKWFRQNKEKMQTIDLVHLHYSGVYAPIFVSLMINKFFSIEQVITIHCSRNFTFIPPNLNSRLFNGFIKKMEIKTINAAKKVIVLTEKQKENYVSIGIRTNKIEVIGDCIPDYHLEVVGQEQMCFQEKWAKVLKSDKRKLTFVGRISFEKGCERLIQIAEKLNREDVVFLIIGDGPQKGMLLDKIREKHLEEKFIISGFISRLKIPYILRNTDVLLVPSRHEEFGGVVLEGVAANVPIITTGVGGITRILGEEYNGIVGNDIGLFTKMINAYLDGEVKFNYNRYEILKKYNSNFSIDKICRIYEE